LNLSNKQLKLIEKYLDKDLSTSEQLEFDENLNDPAFKEQLLFQAQMVDSLGKKEPMPGSPNQALKTSKLPALLMRLAATVLMIFVVLFALKNFATNKDTKTYAKYYEVYPANNSRGVIAKENQEEFNLALTDYSHGKYQAALDRLLAIPEQNEEQALYIASCYMELDQEDEALKLFGGMKKSINSKYRHTAEWYTVLLKLKKKNQDIKPDLNKILSSKDHMYYMQAQKLQLELE